MSCWESPEVYYIFLSNQKFLKKKITSTSFFVRQNDPLDLILKSIWKFRIDPEIDLP